MDKAEDSEMIKLNDSAIVLEIGSGSNPWRRSDVLLDRYYVDETGQRGGGELFVDRRPMIVAAGERLPFKDKAFDFVYCCHVLEHAEDIARMLAEMSRVGKAGFIECPNPLLERVLDQAQHNWYVTNIKGKLLIARKTAESNVTSRADRFYFLMMSDHFIIRNYWDHFVTRLQWQGEIPFEVCDDVGRVFAEHVIDDGIGATVAGRVEKVLRRAWFDAMRELLKNIVRATPVSAPIERVYRAMRKLKKGRQAVPRVDQMRLLGLLQCPHCGGGFEREENGYVCRSCSRQYPDCGPVAVLI